MCISLSPLCQALRTGAGCNKHSISKLQAPEKTVKLTASHIIFGASVVVQGFFSTRQGPWNIRKSAYATMKFSSIAPAHDDSTKSEGSLSSQLLSWKECGNILAIGYWLLASQFNPSLGFWWFRVPDVSCFYLSKWAAVKWYAEGYLQFCIKSKSDARVTNVLFRIVASILAAQMPSWSAAARMRTFARCCANQNSVNLPGEVPMSCLFRHQLYSIVGSMCLDFIGTWMTLHRFRSPCKSLKQVSNPEPVVQRVPCSSKTQWPQHSAILFVNDQASPAGRGHCLAERFLWNTLCESHVLFILHGKGNGDWPTPDLGCEHPKTYTNYNHPALLLPHSEKGMERVQ